MQNNVLIVLAISTTVLGVLLGFTSYGEWSIMAYCALLYFLGLGYVPFQYGSALDFLQPWRRWQMAIIMVESLSAEGASLCTINTTVDCVSINNSPSRVVLRNGIRDSHHFARPRLFWWSRNYLGDSRW